MVYKEVCVSVAQLCLTLCDPTHSSPLLCPWNSPGKNTGVGNDSLLQGIFPIREFNLALWHYRQLLYCLRHLESPYKKVIKVNEVIRVGAGSNRTGILIRRGRGTSDLSPPAQGKGQVKTERKGSACKSAREPHQKPTCRYPDLGFGASRTVRRYVSVVYTPPPLPSVWYSTTAARDKYNRVVSFDQLYQWHIMQSVKIME